jgi:hypothetical protein
VGVTAYDVRARSQAARMLAPIASGGKGQVVTLSRVVAGVYNPATGVVEGGGPVSQTCSGVEESYSAYSIAAGLVLAGDKRFLLSPLSSAGAAITPPIPDVDTLTMADGVAWTVKKSDPLSPAGTPVLFTLQLRKA